LKMIKHPHNRFERRLVSEKKKEPRKRPHVRTKLKDAIKDQETKHELEQVRNVEV